MNFVQCQRVSNDSRFMQVQFARKRKRVFNSHHRQNVLSIHKYIDMYLLYAQKHVHFNELN